MRIGIVYDMKEDFDYSNESIEYMDFCFLSEITSAKYNLELSGFAVDLIGSSKNLAQKIFEVKEKYNLIYNIAEGFKSRNREGLVPAICELYQIPYTGTDAFGLSLSLHKFQTKLFALSLGVPAPNGFLLNNENLNLKDIQYPVIAKPDHEGSSMGLQICHKKEELLTYVNDFGAKYKQDILIEEYIQGKEISVCVLGSGRDSYVFCVAQYTDEQGKDIPLLTNILKTKDHYNMIIPLLPENILEKLKEYSLEIHRSMGLYDISRMDWRVDMDNNPFFLEVTPLPILSKGTEFEWGCKQHGMPFQYVYQSIVNSALKRYNLL